MKVIATKGLPGSGKTTWARQYQATNDKVVVMNNDSIQEALFGKAYVNSPEMASMLAHIRFVLAEQFARYFDVLIIDNTNLSRSAERQVLAIAKAFGDGHVEWQDFTDVPIQVCLERNAQRANPVPEDVIYQMALLLRKE